MKKLLSGLAALPFLASIALAGQPVPLTDAQMDKVSAGFSFMEIDTSDTSTTTVLVNEPAAKTCSNCYLQIKGTTWGWPPVQSLQVYAFFGPAV